MWVTATSAVGFTVGYEITDPAEVGSTTYALAETALVLYDFESARPRRMTPRNGPRPLPTSVTRCPSAGGGRDC